jgi:predicted RNase H-like HicB family nuclease
VTVTGADTKALDRYTIVIRPDDNGTFVAYLPAIPGCHAVGRTAAEAQTELTNVFSMFARSTRRRDVLFRRTYPC